MAERAGEHLTAEADPEDGHARGDRRGDQLAFGLEERIPVGHVDVHVAAEHDDRGDVVERGEAVARVREVLDPGDAGRLERGGGHAERLPVGVPDQRDRSHAAESTGAVRLVPRAVRPGPVIGSRRGGGVCETSREARPRSIGRRGR